MKEKNSTKDSSAIKDLFIISIVSVFLFLAEFNFKAFELLEGWLQKNYGWDTNEFVSAFIIVAVGLVVFSLRRWRKVKAEIVARRQAAPDLKDSEERYRSLVDISPDAIFIQSEGRIAFINPAGVKLFGATSSEELIGKPVLELMHPDFRGIVKERIRILKEERAEVPVLEEKYLRLDGSSVDVEVAAAPFIYLGKPGAQVIARDITERKKMENIFKKERDKAQLYLDIAGVMLVAIDADQKVTLINKKGCEILGYDDETEVVGKNWFDNFVQEKIRTEVKTVFAKLITGDNCLLEYYENPVLTKDGKERIIAWHNAMLRDETGKITGTLSSGEDITERKQGETALCESEGKFRKLSQEFNALLNAIPDTLILLSPDMKVIWANEGAAVGLGKSIPELTGQLCYHIWHNHKAPCDVCPVERSFRTGETENATISFPDGRLWDVRAVPIKDAEGKVISVVDMARDITEHRKLEAQLQQSQKMEAVGTLTGGIAHDFNNILTAIIGYGNILKMKLEKESPLLGYTDQILASAERAANLTQSLLAFSRKQVINPKPVNLNEITASIEKILLRIIGEDIELKTTLSGMRDLRVMADAGQIEQVLMNLAANARDAMPEGGTLTIETGLEELDLDFLKIHEYGKQGMYAILTVTDTGHGMDENTRQRIFEPFFTTKEVGRGTGLGLSMVYGIIKQHSGYINCYSEPEKGTTFKIYLPVIESATEKTKKEEHITLSGGTETILLAEDEEEVRKLMRLALEEAGYKVIEAVDGKEAIEKFRENKDSIGLLLLDVIMPKMNGKGVYEEARKIKPGIKALFSSGYPADFIHKKGILEEGLNFISKPASPHEFLKRIREAIDQ